MSDEFKGQGWRQPEQPGCFAQTQRTFMVQVPPAPYAKPMFSKTYVCQRPKGHKDWHSCDDVSWPDSESTPKSSW